MPEANSNEQNSEQNNNKDNVSLIEYLWEKFGKNVLKNIVSCFIYDVEITNKPENKRQEFIRNLNFGEWFDLYGIKTLKKLLSNVFICILCILLIFILINVNIFMPIIREELKKETYPKENAMVKSAELINERYIIPASKRHNINSILIVPYKLIRNKLYNQAVKTLPKNSALKEQWWFNIKFKELNQWWNYIDWANNSSKTRVFPKNKLDYKYINSLNDEVYSHIVNMKNIKPDENISNADIFKMMLYEIKYYNLADNYSKNCQYLDKKGLYQTKCHQKEYEYIVERNEKLINLIDELKNDIKSRNINDYNKINETMKGLENTVKIRLYSSVLKYYDDLNVIDCNTLPIDKLPELKIDLNNYLNNNKDNIPYEQYMEVNKDGYLYIGNLSSRTEIGNIMKKYKGIETYNSDKCTYYVDRATVLNDENKQYIEEMNKRELLGDINKLKREFMKKAIWTKYGLYFPKQEIEI